MCYAGQTIIEQIHEMQRLVVLAELERVRPDVPCTMCKPNNPCHWHKQPKGTTE